MCMYSIIIHIVYYQYLYRKKLNETQQTTDLLLHTSKAADKKVI